MASSTGAGCGGNSSNSTAIMLISSQRQRGLARLITCLPLIQNLLPQQLPDKLTSQGGGTGLAPSYLLIAQFFEFFLI